MEERGQVHSVSLSQVVEVFLGHGPLGYEHTILEGFKSGFSGPQEWEVPLSMEANWEALICLLRGLLGGAPGPGVPPPCACH